MGTPPLVRRAEVAGVLAMAADIGMGQPGDQAWRSAALAVTLARALGWPPDLVARAHAVALTRHAGCTADSPLAVSAFGNEVRAREWLAAADFGKPLDVIGLVIRKHGEGLPVLTRARMVATALAGMRSLYGTAISHCEVSRQLAARLGFPPDVQHALTMVFERWDNRGVPGNASGEAVDPAARLTLFAHDVEVFYRLAGTDAVLEMVQARRGGAFEPALVDLFLRDAPGFLQTLDAPSPWAAMLEAEPDPVWLDEAALDEALGGLADFADLRCAWTGGHSRGVAELAAAAAAGAGLEPTTLRRAGWLHDLGRVAVSASAWDKPGPLNDSELELVRTHAWHGDRCLARATSLSPYAALATSAHERSDASGYFRGVRPVSRGAAILAAADVYHALREDRPHRTAHAPDAAARLVEAEVVAGRLERAAVDAVLAAAGQPVPKRAHPHDLTEREVEVLCLVARGRSNKQVAQRLGVSPKTIDNHVQHIYEKIGVSTRSGATIFAMRHGLLEVMG